jgi:RNA polymerase sigma-70 factor (ECF subfamily)
MDAIWGGSPRLNSHGWDFKWVLAARAGYELAFDELVFRNKGRVHRLALAITQEPTAADTVLRAAFREAHNRLREFQGTSAFSRWVLGIAAMQALQRLRDERSDATVLSDRCTNPEGSSSSDCVTNRDAERKEPYTRREMKRILAHGLRSLPPLCRTIFVLRDLEQCSDEEVASSLELSQSAVRARLLRARTEVREYLNLCSKRESRLGAGCTPSVEGKPRELRDGQTISLGRACVETPQPEEARQDGAMGKKEKDRSAPLISLEPGENATRVEPARLLCRESKAY